jgi:hypothetical protein
MNVIQDVTAVYRVTIRIWDTTDREQNGAIPTYAEKSIEFMVGYDAAVPPVTSLVAVQDASLPVVSLTWSRSTMPDWWTIIRDGKPIAQPMGLDLLAGSTNYAYVDRNANPRESHTYVVAAVVNNAQSSGNPTATLTVNASFPYLMRTDGTDAIALLNPSRDMAYMASQELHELISNGVPPVVITQSLGGYAGHVEGLLVDDVIPGVTAKQMRNRLRSIRSDPGVQMVLTNIDESLIVVVYNINVTPDSTPARVSYWASFDWVQVVL